MGSGSSSVRSRYLLPSKLTERVAVYYTDFIENFDLNNTYSIVEIADIDKYRKTRIACQIRRMYLRYNKGLKCTLIINDYENTIKFFIDKKN